MLPVALSSFLKMHDHSFLGWQNFENNIEALQSLCQDSAEECLSSGQCLSLLESLRQQLQLQMSDRTETLMTGLGQRHVTELHRLLRLSLTDAALYRSARSVAIRQQRLKQLCDRLIHLRQHTQAIMAAL
jgi:hypothetical protein